MSLSVTAEPEASRASHVPSPADTGKDGRLSRAAIESEIRQRAEAYRAQDSLVVDYYRIRRRLAYPLPVTGLSLPSVRVPTIPVYPWATWMTWALEERICCLGWAAEWFADKRARRAAERDLEALASWPEYRQYGGPDLSSAHAGRILWRAYTQWRWLDEPLRRQIQLACGRHVENVLPESDRLHGKISSKEALRQSPAPHRKIHNIPFIGTVGAALTASVARHAGAARLGQRLAAIFGTILDLRAEGVVEGVSYDGYILDFVADWLSTLPADERAAYLGHASFPEYLQESYMLAAPGTAEQVAELSDVEPREMPFHLSAQAKLHQYQPDPTRAWHLSRCRLDWLRADALAALHTVIDGLTHTQAPKAGALKAPYALVLRTGWEAADLAVAVSCTSSPMGHIQADNGSLTVGTRGFWLITDPGYQQYMKDQEREFTLGPAAHNSPVVNGMAQTRKRPAQVSVQGDASGVCQAVLEFGSCYPAECGVTSALRTVWLAGDALAVVADRLEVEAPKCLHYHWHGHPLAAWWAQSNLIRLQTADAQLWIASPQFSLTGANIHRLPGSRGSLTLVAETQDVAPAIWWIFALGKQPPAVALDPDGLAARAAKYRFQLRKQ